MKRIFGLLILLLAVKATAIAQVEIGLSVGNIPWYDEQTLCKRLAVSVKGFSCDKVPDATTLSRVRIAVEKMLFTEHHLHATVQTIQSGHFTELNLANPIVQVESVKIETIPSTLQPRVETAVEEWRSRTGSADLNSRKFFWICDDLKYDGYIKCVTTVNTVSVKQVAGELKVGYVVHVDGGKQYKIGTIDLSMLRDFPPMLIRALGTQSDGQNLHETQMKLFWTLQGFASAQGYESPQIDIGEMINEAEGTINFRPQVELGTRTLLGSLNVVGLNPVEEAEVMSNVKMKTGDPLNRRYFFQIKRTLPPILAERYSETKFGKRTASGSVDVTLEFQAKPQQP